MRINEDMDLEKVIDLFPETLKVLYGIGYTDLETPVMRHAAKIISVKQAAMLMGAEPEKLVEDLNQAIMGDQI
ncbi:MAG: DUF1858 domain-containing protein [Methanomassiliicoccales archaeon]|jgi:hypothetical protein|nr:DUF1858 domain-containing protein [Methanomassiliicoccales archaeon]MDD1755610.1 DUF1858 domain-containing protein [Methanomassiliicoccales archaeon]